MKFYHFYMEIISFSFIIIFAFKLVWFPPGPTCQPGPLGRCICSTLQKTTVWMCCMKELIEQPWCICSQLCLTSLRRLLKLPHEGQPRLYRFAERVSAADRRKADNWLSAVIETKHLTKFIDLFFLFLVISSLWALFNLFFLPRWRVNL